MKKKITIHAYDAANYLTTDEDRDLYLNAVVEEANGDAAMIELAKRDIERSRAKPGTQASRRRATATSKS